MKPILLVFCLLLTAFAWELEEVENIEQTGALAATCDIAYCENCDPDNVCTNCIEGHYLQNNQCPNCSEKIDNCTICNTTGGNDTINCYKCMNSLFPSNEFQSCESCDGVIPHCSTCMLTVYSPTQCVICSSGYDLSDDKYSCTESSSASTIIIVSAVVGGVVLIGAGFAIFKCMSKKKKGARLLDDQ